MNAKQLGIALALGWFLLPFVACAGVLVIWRSDTEFSMLSQCFYAIIFIPLISGTALFVGMAVMRLRTARAGKLFFSSFTLFLAFITICVSIGFNASPRRLSPETIQTSPVDHYFEYAPQTCFGIPCPYYRVFDSETPDGGYPNIGRTFVDFEALLADIAFWTLPVYLLAALAFTTLPKQAELVQTSTASTNGLNQA